MIRPLENICPRLVPQPLCQTARKRIAREKIADLRPQQYFRLIRQRPIEVSQLSCVTVLLPLPATNERGEGGGEGFRAARTAFCACPHKIRVSRLGKKRQRAAALQDASRSL